MIEAVNSVLANASLVRGNAEQVDVSKSFAANPDRVQEAAPLRRAKPDPDGETRATKASPLPL